MSTNLSLIHILAYSVAKDQTTADDKNDLLYYYAKDFNPGESRCV